MNENSRSILLNLQAFCFSLIIFVFAYFKNVPLISCFLGIGLGVASAKSPKPLRVYSFPFWFCLFSFVVSFLGPRLVFLNPAGSEEFIWGIGQANSFLTQWIALACFVLIFVFIFVWNTRLFITLGSLLGNFLSRFEPLKGYSIDIAGSLFGIWVFTILSYFSTPPLVWFAILLIAFLWFLRKNLKQVLAMLLVGAAFLAYLAVRHEPHQVFWSPYYKIEVIPIFVFSKQEKREIPAGYSLLVNADGHQATIDYSEDFVRRHLDGKNLVGKEIRDLPYRVKPAHDVLVVGAGLGPDVAAAIRNGAQKIDAVEIDPLILTLGRKLHPEKPYSNPAVHAVVDDARSFFKKTKNKYDLIVFGLLDSHTQFSSFSNLRLDNYVYTKESFEDAKSLLKPGGMVYISFSGDAQKIWIGQRFYKMLEQVFGQPPIALNPDSMVLLAGEGISRRDLLRDPVWKKYFPSHDLHYDSQEKTVLSTDDWPFIYLKARAIPKAYWAMIAALLAISLIFARVYLPGQKRIDWPFFLLGSAFLLLETKAVTELALVFGTTWLVNSFVFSGIMILILLGNYAVNILNIRNVLPAYLLLGASLLFNYFFRLSYLSPFSLGIKMALSTFIVLLPIFFAAIIFAVLFKRVRDIPSAFGSNLLGAVLGGFVEYLSLVTGFRFLSLLALGFYALSFWALRRRMN